VIPRRGRQLALWAAAGLAALAGLALLRAWHPGEGAFSVCLFRNATGIPCPGCGMTRAFALLARGEWRAALAMHPLAPLLAAELALAWLAWGWALLDRPPAWMERWWRSLGPVALAHAAVFCALWLGRLSTGTLPW
jgi:hypothetical protein